MSPDFQTSYSGVAVEHAIMEELGVAKRLTEDSSRSIITGETGLAHSGTVLTVSRILADQYVFEIRCYRSSEIGSKTSPPSNPQLFPA